MSKTVLTYCGECDGDKNHKKLFSKTTKSTYSKSTEEFCVVECLGCNAVSFLQIMKVSKKAKPIHFNYPSDEEVNSPSLFLPENNVKFFPKRIRRLYEEVVEAFYADSAILIGVGLRAIVEAVCIEQSITGKNLLKKIEGLHHEGHISKSELPILDKLRVIGNNSAHNINSMPMRKLELAMGIVNHVLISIYVLPEINKRLKLT